MNFDLKEILSTFVVLFAIIDITGSIPVIVDIQQRKGKIAAGKVSFVSFLTMVVFLLAGEVLLNLFGVNVSSFAVAGSIVIFVLAAEMIFDVRIFRDESPSEASYIVPLVFPLIAGAGAFTTLLSLRAEYGILNIIIALALNMLIVYFVLRATDKIEKILGKGTIYILRKFFGIILLAIAVKLFTSNLDPLLNQLSIAKNTEAIRERLEIIK
jgi:multiple antibiotic resistance protein